MFSYPQPQSVENAFPVIKETLPRSSLGYTTNNVYPGFPPIMTDGRSIVASYQPEAVLNTTLIQQNQLQSNWQYRKYLTANADQIMQQNFREACNDMGYFERFAPSERGNAGPITQSGASVRRRKDVGDLQQVYLTRDELSDRQRVVLQSQEALFRKALPPQQP
jgi:hypothetical protein